MNCHKWEPLIALWVGDDLAAEEARGVSDHLRECGACTALERELRDSQTLLKELREEDLTQMGVAVRTSVLVDLSKKTRGSGGAGRRWLPPSFWVSRSSGNGRRRRRHPLSPSPCRASRTMFRSPR